MRIFTFFIKNSVWNSYFKNFSTFYIKKSDDVANLNKMESAIAEHCIDEQHRLSSKPTLKSIGNDCDKEGQSESP